MTPRCSGRGAEGSVQPSLLRIRRRRLSAQPAPPPVLRCPPDLQFREDRRRRSTETLLLRRGDQRRVHCMLRPAGGRMPGPGQEGRKSPSGSGRYARRPDRENGIALPCWSTRATHWPVTTSRSSRPQLVCSTLNISSLWPTLQLTSARMSSTEAKCRYAVAVDILACFARSAMLVNPCSAANSAPAASTSSRRFRWVSLLICPGCPIDSSRAKDGRRRMPLVF